MKAEVQKFAAANGCAARYSGLEETMYISGKFAQYIVSAIKKQFKPVFEVKVSPGLWYKGAERRHEIAQSTKNSGNKTKDKTATSAVKA